MLLLSLGLLFYLCCLSLIFSSIRYAGSYNVIDWNSYYNNGSNYKYYITGSNNNGSYWFDNSNLTSATNQQGFQINTQYQSVLIPVDKDLTKYKNVSYGVRDYYITMNGSSDMNYVSQYEFSPQVISTYYPLMLFVFPINALTYTTFYSYNYQTNVDQVYMDMSPIPFFFASNWSKIWNNLQVDYYCVDNNNNGFAFQYGNQQFNGTPVAEVLPTEYGNLNVNVYNLNVSSQMQYAVRNDSFGNPYNNGNPLPEFLCHIQPLPSYSPLEQYFNLFSSSASQSEQSLNSLIEGLPFNFTQIFGGGGVYPNSMIQDHLFPRYIRFKDTPHPTNFP